MPERDTICALASGATPSAIAIIRLSGPAVHNISERLLTVNRLRHREAVVCDFLDDGGALIDSCVALYFEGPASYTGEDSLELYLHGGAAIIDHAFSCLLSQTGIRLAEPGEFTRRAFEAGKMDLTQAEGVADLIEAETRAQKSQALRQLDGALSETYESWRAQLLKILALLEVSIDFPDEDEAPESTAIPVAKAITTLLASFRRALDDGRIGERVREGFRISIIGPTNAGKSTLLNRLAGRDAAIVTDEPGTTRDVVEVRMSIGGHIVWIADTAGIRETDNVIEAEGIRRARRAAEHADIRLFLTGNENEADPAQFPKYRANADLRVVNKIDLAEKSASPADVRISALTGAGMDKLEGAISDRLQQLAGPSEAPVITRARHRHHLQVGAEHLAKARASLDNGESPELAAEDVRLAIQEVSTITGAIGVEDVLGAVFSEFCIGK